MTEPEASILARVHILNGLNEKELPKITSQCDWRRYDPEQLILDRDSPSMDVYFVREGEVRAVNYSYLGREVQFTTLHPGHWILRPYPPEKEIARLAGTNLDTVSRAISHLRQAGFAERRNLNLYIRERDRIVGLIDKYQRSSGT